jgi:hypothetical protein
MGFALSVEESSPEVEMSLYLIGKAHAQRAIRPWMYSAFMQTLMNTLSSRLGNEASKKVMEAWVNLFAYIMKFLLPPAIQGRVVETEMNINTSSAFAEGRVFAEVAAMEEVKEFNKKIKSRGSSANPSIKSSARGFGFEPLGATFPIRGDDGDDEGKNGDSSE